MSPAEALHTLALLHVCTVSALSSADMTWERGTSLFIPWIITCPVIALDQETGPNFISSMLPSLHPATVVSVMLKACLPLQCYSVHCHSSQRRRDEMTQTRSHVHGRMFTVQVPRSSKLIYEDNDYALYSVTLFKRVADSFKQAARSKGFQVHI